MFIMFAIFLSMKERAYDSSFNFPRDYGNLLLTILLTVITRKVIKNKVGRNIWKNSNFNDEYKRKLSSKFEGSFYRGIIYFVFLIIELITVYDQGWILRPILYIEPWPDMPRKIIVPYFLELSHYIVSTFFLFSEPKLADFYQMLSHHLVTIYLIYFSYDKGYVNGPWQR